MRRLALLVASCVGAYACGAVDPEPPTSTLATDAGSSDGPAEGDSGDSGDPRDSGNSHDSSADAADAGGGASCAGVTTPCNLAPDSLDTEGIAVTGSSVFFTERRPVGAVRRVDSAGGPVVTIATPPMPGDVVVQGSRSQGCGAQGSSTPAVLAWLSEGSAPALTRRQLDPGKNCTIYPPIDPLPTSGDGHLIGNNIASLRWSSPAMHTITLGDFLMAGTSEVAVPGASLAIAESSFWLYWTDHASAGGVHRISNFDFSKVEVQGGGTPGAYDNIEGIAASDYAVAWTSGSGVFASKSDSASFASAAELLDPAVDGRGIAIDHDPMQNVDTVYYLAGGQLRTKVLGSSDPPRTLATVCAGHRSFVGVPDDGYPIKAFYWTCGSDGGVFRMPLPPP